uniref:Class II aldolase/adducin N-terminal domain-containing protein n=1 Tax=Pseudo-nitzschia australis TaxID=44445 RepID=A0A7S4AWX2_9STRA|mmetsp:Transcript_143/g.362  ORF Transcript_143/g.362 Transcript_143/m.362 type:complete len:329 (-) Transcript_143:346-1332(-)
MNALRLFAHLPRFDLNPIGRQRYTNFRHLLSQKRTRHFSSEPYHSYPEIEEANIAMSREEIEWQQRCQLAVCYRMSYMQGWHENIFNHITLKVHNSDNTPDGPHFFINEFGVGFDEMKASSILKVNLDGDVVVDDNSSSTSTTTGRVFKPGFVIHSAIHGARPDTHAVWHVHPLDTTAVCQTKFGLLPISQEASLAAKRGLSYHPFEGTANTIDERGRLVDSLGPTNQILMLENHGPLMASPTLHQAFAGMFFLTRACTFQIKALSSVGGDLSKIHMPSQDLEEEILARSKKFDEAPQKGIQHDSDKLMFDYAVRAAEQAFGKDDIYR